MIASRAKPGVWCRAACAALLLGAPRPAIALPPAAASEYQLKAAFLYNFAKFVDWPPGSFASAVAPFRLCVLGLDPFGSELDSTLEGKSVNGHPIALVRNAGEEDVTQCHVVFVAGSEASRLSRLLGRLPAGVLTVADLPRFAEHGGMIGFVMAGSRVNFEINPEAAEKARVRISSKLLKLAKIVR
jgi:hypothetical protein